MRIKTGLLLYVILFLFIHYPGFSGQLDINQEDTTDINIDKVRELISFLEYSLNTVGDGNTPPREKDIIITASYKKIFRDADVQVEDDLTLGRSTVTNKDVQAYLKDVDFFFKNVAFILEIEEIQKLVNDSSQLFYLVKLNRNLNGISVLGDTVNQSITRFVEVNYNEDKEDLKIVSFYTTKLSEEEDLKNWWEQLTFEWKYIFQQRFNYYDSVTVEDLKILVAVDSLDLSSNRYIEDFEPLFRLNQLKYLDLSNTSIQDLSPLRVHNKLEYLDISNTGITEMQHIKYAANLRYLNASKTQISNLEILEYFQKINQLELEECHIDSITLFTELPQILDLNLSKFQSDSYDWLLKLREIQILNLDYSNITDLELINELEGLQQLSLEGLDIDQIEFINGLENLAILNVESTNVNTLDSLSDIPALKKIYCDNSGISKESAVNFMNKNPGVLVIFESEELKDWWANLPAALKEVFSIKLSYQGSPGIDQLAKIPQIDSLNLSSNKDIRSLEDLWPLRNLKYLDISDTYITDIKPVVQLSLLEHINAGYTNIADIQSIEVLKNLSYLNLNSTIIDDIENLSNLRGLTYLNIDNTSLNESKITRFIRSNPACLVIYRTQYLNEWWEELSDEWKHIFLLNSKLNEAQLDSEGLHKITYLKKVRIDSIEISSISPLNEFYFLEDLYISRTRINDISDITKHSGISKLTLSKSPIFDIAPLNDLKSLKYLDISNTGIIDVSSISNLSQIEVLKIAGTKIKNLNSLEDLYELKELDISSTIVKSFKPIRDLKNLERIVCYNTKLKQKATEDFKSTHPDCQIYYY